MAIPVIGDLINGVKDIVSEVVVDKDKRDQVNLELARLEDQAQARLDAQTSDQIEVNKVEAASGSVFVAGWRPAVGWVGATGLLYSTLVQPLASWTATVVFAYRGAFPAIDNQLLLYVLGGMLGIGGMRTYEKVKGVATNDMSSGVPKPTPSTDVQVTPEGDVSVQQKGAAQTAAPRKHFHIF